MERLVSAQMLAPLFFVLLWATGFIGAKLGLPHAPPLKFLLWRFVLVVLVMLPVALALRATWPRGRAWLHVAVAGVLLQAGYLGGVFVSISWGLTAGVAALVVGLQPVLTACLGRTVGEQVSARQWCGLVLGFVGVAMVVSPKIMPTAGAPVFSAVALLPCLLALVCITVGTLYQKKFCGAQDLRTQSVVQFSASVLVLLPLSLAFETRAVQWTGEFVFALAWLVVVLSFGATSLLFVLIRRGAATGVASLMYLVPPVTAVIAYGLFDERLTVVALAGMGVAVLGVALALPRTVKSRA